MTKISFKLKLVLSYIVIILLSFGFLAFFLDKNLEENSLREIKSSLAIQADLMAGRVISENLRHENYGYLQALAKELGQKAACRVTVINTPGEVLADSEKTEEGVRRMENHLTRPEVRSALTGKTGVDTHYSHTLKIDMLYVAVPLADKGQVAGVLRLALPLTSVRETLFTIRKTVLIGLAFALAVALVLGSVLAARTISPVNRMIHVSRKFAEGDFSRRVIRISRDEIGELAATLNTMAQHIEDKIRETAAQNQKLAAIFKSMVEGVIVVDESGRIISVNSTIERLFGVEDKEAKGKMFLEAVRNNNIFDCIDGVLKSGRAMSREVSLNLPVRGVFHVNAVPIFEDDEVKGCLTVIHDITEIRKLETMRRDFVANVSHELKTPLTSIKGFVETLLEGAMDDKENNRQFLKIIQEHANRLDGLIGDLLSLSHLESKEISLERKEFNLKEQADEVIAGFKSQLKKKNIEIKNDLTPGLMVKADKTRIGQVLTNLVDNAIKFNKDNGRVKIYSDASGHGIKIVVEDSGIGILEKDSLRIFERFYRVDKARSRELGGTGLGLSIVKHIVELHGGSVGVESVEGLGSKFWFILPKQGHSLQEK